MKKGQQASSVSLFEHITSVYLILLASLFLLITETGGYQQIQETKFRWFLLLCGGYIILMWILVSQLSLIGAMKFSSPVSLLKKATPAQLCVVLYLLFTWVSALLSPCFPQSIIGVSRYEGALTITVYCMCFLLVSVYGRATASLLYVFSASTLLLSGLCIIQLHGLNPLGLYPPGYSYMDAGNAYLGAYLGTVGNVDLLAAYYCLAIPILWIALLRGTKRMRLFLLLPLLTSLYVACKMFVLAGLVGLVLGSAFSLPLLINGTIRKKQILAVLLALTALFCLSILYHFDIGDGFLHELHAVLRNRATDLFGSGRIRIWRLVWKRIPQHLWFGTGPDTMANANIEAFSRYDVTLEKTLTTFVDVAHNEYLNILYHQGLLALLSYLAFLVCIFAKWVRCSKDNVCAALGFAVLCYVIQACFGFSMCMAAPYFWTVAALLERKSLCNEKGV